MQFMRDRWHRKRLVAGPTRMIFSGSRRPCSCATALGGHETEGEARQRKAAGRRLCLDHGQQVLRLADAVVIARPRSLPTPRKLKRTAVQPACTKARANVPATLLCKVPPNSGCGCAITAVPAARHRAPDGRSRPSIRPAGPGISRYSVREFTETPSAPDVGRGQQALDHPAVAQVRLDDLVDVALVDEGVPDRFRIDHGDRAAGAAIQAAGLVDADLARPSQAQLLDPGLAVVERLLAPCAAQQSRAIVALVETEEDMPLVIGVGLGRSVRSCRGIVVAGRDAQRQPQPNPERRIGPEPAQPPRQAMDTHEGPARPGVVAAA